MSHQLTSIDDWLKSRDWPVSSADQRLISLATPEVHLAIADELRNSGLHGVSCACVPQGRFPVTRRIQLQWADDPTRIIAWKKWLYECGIRFSTEVRVHYYGEATIYATWKQVIRNWPLFLIESADEDCVVTDTTLQWALTFCHHNVLTFSCYRNRPKAGRKSWDRVLE